MRRIAAALSFPLLAVLVLAGCGSSSSSPSAASDPNGSVAVSGAFGAVPAVKIPASQASGKLAIKTVIKGTGQVLGASDSFVGNYAVYIWSGASHKEVLSTFSTR